jgi:hypothetical protein
MVKVIKDKEGKTIKNAPFLQLAQNAPADPFLLVFSKI